MTMKKGIHVKSCVNRYMLLVRAKSRTKQQKTKRHLLLDFEVTINLQKENLIVCYNNFQKNILLPL